MTGKDKAYLVMVSQQRDELLEQVAELEKAIQLGDGHSLTLQREKRLDDEAHRLSAALEKYGRHLDYCGSRWHPGRCSCGLAEALKGAPEERR